MFHKGQRYTISIGESVVSKYWNDKTHRCRTIRDYPEASHINTRLDDWTSLIEDAINGFGLIIPTPKMVKDKVNNIQRTRNIEAGGVTENEEEQYLVKFAEHYRDNSIVKKGTKTRYTTAINKLKEFEKHIIQNYDSLI